MKTNSTHANMKQETCTTYYDEINAIMCSKLNKTELFILFVPLNIYIYIYKEIISVCLLGCPIITHEPLVRFASNFGWGTGENHGNVFSFEILS